MQKNTVVQALSEKQIVILNNWLCGLDVIWQPIRENLTTFA